MTDSPEPVHKRPVLLSILMRVTLFTILLLFALRVLNRDQTFAHQPRYGDGYNETLNRVKPRVFDLALSDGTRLHCWVVGPDDAPRKILFCNGNGGFVDSEARVLHPSQNAWRAQILYFDYPGYNKSTGSAGEGAFYRAARAAWTRATDPQGDLRWRPEDITVYGFSLGAAVACKLTHDLLESDAKTRAELWGDAADRVRGPRGLILQAPFASIAEMARFRMGFLLIPHWLILCGFDNLARAPALKVPALVIHGRQDEVLPFEHGRRVYEALPGPKKFIELDAMHNDLWIKHRALLEDEIARFLQTYQP